MPAIPLLLFSALAAVCTPRSEEPPDRPNIVVLVSDDQAIGTMGYEGHPWSKTPMIDLLAREGVVFNAAFVTTPLCSPSRASLLTGLYARSHGTLSNRHPLRTDLPTLATLLTSEGYDTAYVGKWHMGTSTETRPGFTYSATFNGQGTYRQNTFLIGTPDDHEEVVHYGWVDDVTTDLVLEFLHRPRTAPFLLVVGFKSPHRPHLPPPRHAEDYADCVVEIPPNADALPPFVLARDENAPDAETVTGPGEGVPKASHASGWRGGISDGFPKRTRNYFQAIAGIDDNVGRVRDTLKELGVEGNTIVVYTSDNGFCIGNHGVVGKAVLYEEAVRVPLVLHDPRRFKPHTVARPVANVDIAPTLLELAGVAPERLDAQGRSLVPDLLGHDAPPSAGLVLEYYRGDARADAYGQTSFALRTTEWKLIVYPDGESWTELFHLVSDPFEMKNLAGDPAHAEQLARMRAGLASREAELGPRGL